MAENSSPTQTRDQVIHENDPPFEVLDTARTHVEDDEDSMEEDEVVGLPLLSGNYGRRKAFEMELRSRNQDEPSTCFEETWRLVASVFLAICLLGLFVHSYFQNHHGSQVTESGLFSNSSIQPCALALESNFSQLYQDMAANKTTFCDTTLPDSICKCTNPVLPRSKMLDAPLWSAGRQRNIALLDSVSEIDVLFLGDSITEHWMGTSLTVVKKDCVGIVEVFHQLFGTSTGKYSAIPLGLSGDRCNELLYRIQNGELPDTLHPRVIWILIGTNDYARGCSKESILAGNLAVLKEVMDRKPDTPIVINSILPVGPSPLIGDEPNARWEAYQWINARLECLASSNQNLFFFNGTSYFLTEDGRQINQALMDDFLHPSKEGSLLWGSAIVETLHELLG